MLHFIACHAPQKNMTNDLLSISCSHVQIIIIAVEGDLTLVILGFNDFILKSTSGFCMNGTKNPFFFFFFFTANHLRGPGQKSRDVPCPSYPRDHVQVGSAETAN